MPETAAVHLSASARAVAEALAQVERTTVVALANAAMVSKSTVAKTLAALECSGDAFRTVREKDGIREADLWSPGAALGDLLFATDAGAPGDGGAESSPTATEVAAGSHSSGTPSDTEVAGEPDNEAYAALAPEMAATGCLVPASSLSAEVGAETGVGQTRVPATTTPVDYVAVAPDTNTAASEPGESTSGGRVGRLAAGELAAMVEAALAGHPDIEYTPTMLSHLLGGRSPGAIQNALEKMVASGRVLRTRDKPKAYRRAAAEVPHPS